MKKIIIAVSFGTSDDLARETCILPVEDAYARAFPDWEVRRAFTSRVIRTKLARSGIVIESPEEAIVRARGEGAKIIIASTHVIPGQEYERLCACADGLPVTDPLLLTDEDLDTVACQLKDIREASGRTLIMMGHGTEHAADETYRRLRARLSEGVYLACVEGEQTLDTILPVLTAASERRVALMPLMLVAGEHARNDMAGDGPDSWKSMLTAAGFDVEPHIEGLGSLKTVQDMYIKKLAAKIREG